MIELDRICEFEFSYTNKVLESSIDNFSIFFDRYKSLLNQIEDTNSSIGLEQNYSQLKRLSIPLEQIIMSIKTDFDDASLNHGLWESFIEYKSEHGSISTFKKELVLFLEREYTFPPTQDDLKVDYLVKRVYHSLS